MRNSIYHNYGSFSGKIRVSFLFLSIMPYLIVIYLFVMEKIEATEMMLLFSPLILFSILTGFSIIRRSADQLVRLVGETRLIVEGKKSELVKTTNADYELNEIARHFNSLFNSLQEANREMREQSVQLLSYAKDLSRSYKKAKREETLRNRLTRYVGKNLVDRLMAQKEGEFFENERKKVTVLFADIRSFTSIAEVMQAEELIVMLNEFYDRMVDIIFKNSGVLDKFVGDQIVAVFGLIEIEGDPSSNAIKAALEMQQATESLMKLRAETGKQLFSIGIGINTGYAIVGNIGSRNRMDYTVMGDCVNTAAKIQQVAKGGEIVLGDNTYQENKGKFPIKNSARMALKNKTEPVQCYYVARCKDDSLPFSMETISSQGKDASS
jgi:class 3 adenylate cyclase